MDLQETFISNLKRFRKMRHITQEELAERCETDTSYIGQIETKKRFPSLSLVEKIAAALEIQAYQLYKPQEQSPFPTQKLQEALIASINSDITRLIEEYTISLEEK